MTSVTIFSSGSGAPSLKADKNPAAVGVVSTAVAAGPIGVTASVVAAVGGAETVAAAAGPIPAGEAASWQLASGHYVPAKMAMTVVYPRPDTETASTARHRHAYYDGSNAIQYKVPVAVQGGARPFRYELVSGPAGMEIGEEYGDANYGVLTWTPSSSLSDQTVTVRVHSQDEGRAGLLADGVTTADEYVDVTYTVSSGSSNFVFFDIAAGADGDGTISSPFNSYSSAVGDDVTDTANAGKIMYLRAGTYDMPGYASDALGKFQIHGTYRPVAYLGYPGESVIADCASTDSEWTTRGGASDLFIQSIIFDGADDTATGPKQLNLAGPGQDRVTVFDSTFRNMTTQGAVGQGTNPAAIGNNDVTDEQEYLTLSYLTFNNNEVAPFILFSGTYGVAEHLTTTNCAMLETNGDYGYRFKNNNYYWTMAYCEMYSGNSNVVDVMTMEGQNGSANIEMCYCKLRAAAASDQYTDRAMSFNGLGGSGADQGPYWIYRNTIHGTARIVNTPPDPIVFENNVWIADSERLPAADAGVEWTFSGTECHLTSSVGATDALLNLEGAYRTNYLGIRGSEIA